MRALDGRRVGGTPLKMALECRRTLRRSDLGGPDDFLVDLFSVLKRSVSSLASCIDRGLTRSVVGGQISAAA